MSVTGVIAFIVFLLIANVLDKKKKKARRRELPPRRAQTPSAGGMDCSPPPWEQEETEAHGAGEVRQEEEIFRIPLPLPYELEERVPHERQLHRLEEAHRAGGERRQAPGRKRREGIRPTQEGEVQLLEAPLPHLADGLTASALLEAVVLAEIIGRPKAQRRRNPYFRQ